MEELIIIEDLEPEEIVLLEEQVEYIKPTGEKEITANGIYDVTDYSSANVNVPAPAPDLENLTITPTTSEQTFNHPNKGGYDEVVVNGVTNSIDSNIQAENIKKDVSILGIIGTLEAPDLNEYFNMTPTAEELSNRQYWVQKNYIKKVENLIIPDTITSLEYLCSGSSSAPVYYCPKVINNNQVTNISSLYYNNLAKEIDVSGLNTSNVTNMKSMFNGCQGIESIDLDSLNTSKATNISSMFANCMKLKNIDISNLDLSNVSSGTSSKGNVFNTCSLLEKAIITPKYNQTLYSWFTACYSLKTLVLLKEDGVCGYQNTFYSCYHMDGTVNATYNPEGLKDGRIYVPDNLVNSYKTASGWSTYAGQILPLSQYVE